MTDLNSITIENLHKKFEDIKALDGLSFKVNAGEMFIIVGPDGAGKSTLLRILAGILPFEEGHVQTFDRTLPGDEEKIKLKLGYMPQRFGLYEDLTVHENLKFFYSLYNLPRRNRDEVFRRMFEFSGLERFKKRLAGDLSGGMKQKLGLSCALLHKPSLLLLDEPTNGVDPYSRRIFWNILNEFKEQGVTIIVATPFMDEAERGDGLLLMMKGKKLAGGSPSQVKKLWTESLYEAVCHDSRRAKATLDSSALVKRTILFGSKIHFVPESDQDIGKIRDLLKREDHLIDDIKKIEPELEDLFINLVRQ
jgi:ABC-2 type transport system ATP-binding protein